jgi:hypothetical protein
MLRAVVLLGLLLLPWPAAASEWGGIQPGVSSLEQVRERYGPPTKETKVKVEGYDTVQWLYEGNRSPAGMARMTVDFGMLVASVYRWNVVRVLTIEPKPAIFGRETVVQGWGLPDGIGNNPDGTVSLFWKDGLIVTLDKEGENAAVMVFSPPQPNVQIRDTPPPAPATPPPGAPAPKQ